MLKDNIILNLSLEFKNMLNDIVIKEYKDSNLLNKFLKFNVLLENRKLKSKLGDYNLKNKTIRIFNLEVEDYESIIITSIHELSHHIQYISEGKTSHNDNFYKIHVCLLKKAIDMGILSVNDILNSNSKARNTEKLKKYFYNYEPAYIDYNENRYTIFVYNAYTQKDTLKKLGFVWNPIEQAWQIYTYKKEFFMKKLQEQKIANKDIVFIFAKSPIIRIRTNVILAGITYNETNDKQKNIFMKKYGFKWDKEDAVWEKKIFEPKLPIEEYKELKKIKKKVTIKCY